MAMTLTSESEVQICPQRPHGKVGSQPGTKKGVRRKLQQTWWCWPGRTEVSPAPSSAAGSTLTFVLVQLCYVNRDLLSSRSQNIEKW